MRIVFFSDQNTTYNAYDLDGQIRHKLDFIRQYVPSHIKLYIVSHSIGCHMSLQVLKRLQEQNSATRVEKMIMLFPTIKHMADTRHGKIASPLLRYFQWFAYLLVVLLSYLSPIVQYRMVLWYFAGKRVAGCAYNAALNLFNPTCTHNYMYLADHELKQVRDPDYQFIHDNIEKIVLYYGVKDHWCPVSYFDEMKALFPDGDIHLCQRNFEHAFVLRHSKEMAPIVWDWVAKCRT